MDSNLLAKQIAGELINSFTSALRSLNPFTFLQVIFIIELYYLMINSIVGVVIEILYNDKIILSKTLPTGIQDYNISLMKMFEEYSTFILVLSICMFICGISLFVLKHLPIISNYKLIRMYCDYGVYASVWLFLIWISYEAFLVLHAYFILFFISIFVVGALIAKLRDSLLIKLGLAQDF